MPNVHDYLRGLAEEYRQLRARGAEKDAKNVLAEIERIAVSVEGVWHPKENVKEDLSTDDTATVTAGAETVTPEAAPEKAA